MRLALSLIVAVVVSGCVAPVAMQTMSDAEIAECEAAGGSVQPAYVIDTYVCLLPNASERSDSRGE